MRWLYLFFILISPFTGFAFSKPTTQNPIGGPDVSVEVSGGGCTPCSSGFKTDCCRVSLRGSYLLWKASEGGLDFATTQSYVAASNTVVAPSNGGTTIFEKFHFSEGYHFGFNYVLPNEGWILALDYTSFHQTVSEDYAAPATTNGTGTFLMTSWFVQRSNQNQTLACTRLNSSWRLAIDWIDLILEKPVRLTPRLELGFQVGARSLFLNQRLKLDAMNTLNISPPGSRVESNQKSRSWAIGPRLAATSAWALPKKFRMEADLGVSLFFSRYTKLYHREDPFTANGTVVSFREPTLDAVRSMFEILLGFGWGGGIRKEHFYLDLFVGYEWKYLPNQNLLRQMNDRWSFGSSATAGDVSIQGLTVKGHFCF